MAKKKAAVVEAAEEVLVEQTTVSETVKPKVRIEKEVKPSWEIKDRLYVLKNNMTPLTYRIPSSKIMYFDEELGYEREVTYTLNQRSPFNDEFKGEARLGSIVFRNGSIMVPKAKQTLQKILSLYHPLNGKLYKEIKPVQEASNQIGYIELELDAMNAAVEMDVDMAEAIMRVEYGSKVSMMSSKELKRDLLLYAKKNPALFLELADDENIQLRNTGIRATELGIIKISSDNRTFMWGTNDRKLMTVPFDEHPYSALAAWFKTDEGMEVLQSIEKRLK